MIKSNISQVIALLRKLPAEVPGVVLKAIDGKVAGVDLVTKLRAIADKTIKAQWALERDVLLRVFYEKLHPQILATLMKLPIAGGVEFTMTVPTASAQTSARIAAGKQFQGDATPLFKKAHPQFDMLDPEWQRTELGNLIQNLGEGFQATHSPFTGGNTGGERRDMTLVRDGMFRDRPVADIIEELKPHWEILHNAILQWVTEVKETELKDRHHSNTKDGTVATDEDIARNLEYALGLRGGGGTSPAQQLAAESLLPHLVNFLVNDPELSAQMGLNVKAPGPFAKPDGDRVYQAQRAGGRNLGQWTIHYVGLFKTKAEADAYAKRLNESPVTEAEISAARQKGGMASVTELLDSKAAASATPTGSRILRLTAETARAWLEAVLHAWTAELRLLLRHRIESALESYFKNLTAKQPALL